jgi:serine phosphatase RsbU (regulator of sigma subunit)
MDPSAVPEILAVAGASLGVTDLVLYLIDFGRTTLEPLPDRSAHADLPMTEKVTGTMAGRAFTDQATVTVERDDGSRVWVPLVEGSDCTGVVAFTLGAGGEIDVQACEDLGLLAGYLIAAHARCTDLYNLHRRRRSMSLAASMQWDLLPPLVMRTPAMHVAGHVEPAYEVGGDCFDYAVNGSILDFAIMDAMGHGVASARAAALAMGAYRHGRREARPLLALHEALGEALTTYQPDLTFVTGLLGRLDTTTGVLAWTNAGHPLPLLIRGGQVIGELACPPTPPWGLADGTPVVATETLEPGDSVLLYTDGVVEARTAAGSELGLERLVDLLEREAAAETPPEETLRRLIRSTLDHRGGTLRDDATLVLLRWVEPETAAEPVPNPR